MKGLLLLFLSVVVTLSGCIHKGKLEQYSESEHRMVKEIVHVYSKTDSPYVHYGYYKEVFRIYNYCYIDSTWFESYSDDSTSVSTYINEYGDTVCVRCIDYSNYPRREED